jgi:hypothetical protein
MYCPKCKSHTNGGEEECEGGTECSYCYSCIADEDWIPDEIYRTHSEDDKQ